MACLFLLNSLKVGGSEAKTVKVASALHEKGYSVHLGYLNSPDTLKLEVHESVPLLNLNREGKFDPHVVLRLREYVRKNQIKKLLCINLYSTLYGAILQVAFGRKNVQCISFVNTTDFADFRSLIQMVVYWPFLKFASRIVFGCRSQQNQWISRYRLNPSRCSYVYNGVDCDRFSPQAFSGDYVVLRKRFGFAPTDVVIVNVAQFRPEKKQEDLIVACAKLVQERVPLRLVFVGDGPEKQRLVQATKEAGLGGRVHFFGQLKDVRPVLSAADIFALSSVSVETFSNAALEAMAMGKPVVLSDVGGASEMVIDGQNGFLYPASNVPALVERLAPLVGDSQLRQEMGYRAREVVRERFGFDSMVGEYERLLAEPRPY